MEPLEIEVKFHIKNIDRIRKRIMDLSAQSQGRCFETNIRLEDDKNSFIRRRALLRLRKDKKTTLTFKSEHPDEENQFKIFKELEVEVNDFSVMLQILESIGFHREQVYEKWRETFMVNNTVICIDTLPFGSFIEIEGTGETIEPVSERLGLKWKERILLNYLALFEIIKQKSGLNFKDVTFDNFKTTEIDLRDYFHLFRIGGKEELR